MPIATQLQAQIDALQLRINTLAPSATPEDIVMLAKAVEAVGGQATVFDVIGTGEIKKAELIATAQTKSAEVLATGDSQIDRVTTTGDIQVARVATSGDTQVTRVVAEGSAQVSILQGYSPHGTATLALATGQVQALSLAQGKHFKVTAAGLGAAIQLPDATQMMPGRDRFSVGVPTGSRPVGVLDAAGQVLGQIEFGDTLTFHLLDNASPAGVWEIEGNCPPFWIANTADLSLVANSYSYTSYRNRCLYYGRDISGYPFVQSVSFSGDSILVSPMVLLSTLSESIDQLLEVDANRYLFRFAGTKWRVIDFTDPQNPQVGNQIAMSQSLWRLDRFGTSTHYAVLRIDTAAARIHAAPLSIEGTSITLGPEVQGTIFCTNWHSISYVYALSESALGLLIMANNSADNWYRLTAIRLLRNPDGTLSFGTAVQNPSNVNTNNTSQQYQAFYLGDTRAIVCYMDSSQRVRASLCAFEATASYSPDVLTNLTPTGSWSYTLTRLDQRRFYLGASSASALTGQVVDAPAVGNTITLGNLITMTAGTTLNTNAARIAEDRLFIWGGSEYFALLALTEDGTQSVLQASFAGSYRVPVFAGNGWGNFSSYELPNYRHALYFTSQGGTAPYSQSFYRISVIDDRLSAVPLAHSEDGSIGMSNWQTGRPVMLAGSNRRYGIDVGRGVRFGRERSYVFNDWLGRLDDRKVLARAWLGHGASSTEVRIRHLLLRFAEA